MKNSIFIIFTFISFSISSQQIDFEKTFGKKNVETLNLLIENFETKTLKKQYPNLKTENSYKKFLKNILKNNSVKERRIFVENNLKLNIYCVSDSVWIEERKLSSGKKGEMIKTKYKCLNPSGEIIYTSSTSYCCSEKTETLSLLKKSKNRVQINISGLYIKALKQITNKSKFIESYIENIEITGEPITPYAMSEYILNNNIDMNDYFVKRLIFINMVYR